MKSASKEILARTHPFTKLKPKDLDKLFSLTESVACAPGDLVYAEGQPGRYCYILVRGRLMAFATQEAGEEVEIELIKKGKPFGIISIFTQESHSVTVRAIEHSVVLAIEKDDFQKFLRGHPLLALDFSQILSKRVKKRAGRPKKIFQSLAVCVCGCTDKTLLTGAMEDIAAAVWEQTRKKVIGIEISFSDNFTLKGLAGANSLNCEEFEEETVAACIRHAEPMDILCVESSLTRWSNVFSLFNYLAENYHFVFYVLPSFVHQRFLQMINPAHTVLFLSGKEPGELMVIHQIEQIMDKKKGKLHIVRYLPPAQEESLNLPDAGSDRYRRTLKNIARELGEKTVGIVLGSGGAFGYAHIGVLNVLSRQGVEIDIVAGSSMGAFIAALWAFGYAQDQLLRYAAEFGKLLRISPFSLFSVPLRGFFKAKKVEAFLKSVFRDKKFCDADIKLRIVTFDFLRRQSHIIDEGLIYKAVAASCAMPGVVEPILFQDTILLDGGILNPVPVSSLTDYAKKIIAVNVTPSRDEIVREYRKAPLGKLTIFDFIFGSIETMQREFIERALQAADVVIHPDMEGLRWTEFSKITDFIHRGEAATLSRMKSVLSLLKE